MLDMTVIAHGSAIRDSHLFLDPRRRIGWGVGMPRVARIVVAGRPHHVTQRGKNRQGEAELSSIRLATHRGRPPGSDSLLSKLERRLRPLPIGRPKKRETGPRGNAKESGKAEKQVTVPNGTAVRFRVD